MKKLECPEGYVYNEEARACVSMGEFQKRFKHLDEMASEDWWPELEHMMEVVAEAKKEFLDIEETELPLKVNGKVDWEKTAQIMELRNIIRLKWFEKWFEK